MTRIDQDPDHSFRRDPASWDAATYPVARSWVQPLEKQHLDEIDESLRRVKSNQLPWTRVNADNFALPRTRELLIDLQRQLDHGAGFAVIGNLPVDRYDIEENRIIYCGLCSHLGTIVPQTSAGDYLIDVTDIGKPYSHRSRGYSSNQLLPFHTDGADVAGLSCLGTSAQGGASILVSAPRVYEIMKDQHRDQLEILERGFFHHRRGEQASGESPLSSVRIPVFQFYDGLLHTMYNRNPIDWVRHEGLELSDEEVDALDTLDTVLARPELQLSMDMRKGDMQFINNFVIFHSRTSYQDSSEQRRHLLRVWLNLDSGRRRGPTLLDLYSPDTIRPTNTNTNTNTVERKK